MCIIAETGWVRLNIQNLKKSNHIDAEIILDLTCLHN